MTKKNVYSYCDDISDVAGVRTTDRLLEVGHRSLPFMKKYVTETVRAEDECEMDDLRDVYDKVFVDADDLFMNEEVIRKIVALNVGLIVFFSENDNLLSDLQDHIETYYYPHRAWVTVSNVGKCLVTDANGYPFVYSKRATQEDIRRLLK